ncbi:hypothetical protein PhaeoP23_01180 [Phaeobacter piscinae]|uniref:Uncharacterized protein n=1 Tax=Phaeobacter piscinae TaxID=1580596 RepID=A0ABM6PCK8_9RHOB|nr:hypothetical protein PhaeoP36_01180 [Phaeobacter piscinae]AUQ85853.1 hypothetical protein PhaeoP42_01180 [Phaeobacter piscinae]AUR23737.1 hypothetical protein PhaeoP23_01180 [Phaeobacter piscinae]
MVGSFVATCKLASRVPENGTKKGLMPPHQPQGAKAGT